jgi:multiple sugar transport system substrate-binding protein
MLTASGCGGTQSEPSKESDSEVTQSESDSLAFRITWKTYSGRGEAISRIVEAYNAQSDTTIPVKLVDGDEDLMAIEGLLDKGGSVDIYMLPYRYVQYFGYENKLDDMTDELQVEEHLFFDKLWKLCVVDDKVYGVPWLGHSMGLIYNKDLLERAGVDPAAINSPEALAEACRQVEEKTGAVGIGLVGANHNDVSWMVNQFIYGYGGSLVSPDGKTVMVNSDAARMAIDFYRNVLGQHAQKTWVTDTGVEVMDYFRNQQVAFEIQGLWGITDIWKADNKFETGVIPLEQLGLCPEIGPMMVSLQPGLSKERRAASIDFIQFLITQKAQDMIMEGEYSPEHDAYYPFRLPVRKDITKSMVFRKYPEFAVFLSGFSNPSIDVPVPLWQHVKDEYYAPGLHEVMAGTMTVDDFLKQVELEGNKILDGEE